MYKFVFVEDTETMKHVHMYPNDSESVTFIVEVEPEEMFSFTFRNKTIEGRNTIVITANHDIYCDVNDEEWFRDLADLLCACMFQFITEAKFDIKKNHDFGFYVGQNVPDRYITQAFRAFVFAQKNAFLTASLQFHDYANGYCGYSVDY